MPKGDCAMETDAGWSGWPGAYCLTCGKEDPMEQAVADGNYNPLDYESGEGLSPTWKPGTHRLYNFNCGLRGKEPKP